MPSDFTLPYVTKRKPWVGFVGYQSDAKKFSPAELAPPSLNVMIDESNRAGQRLGYMTESLIGLGVPGKTATSYYFPDYDITVFAIDTKVKYYDWTTQTVYDTGITLTAGTTTRFADYCGDLYLTNTTDGLRRLVFFRLNGTVTAGDNHITIDNDGAARLSTFSINSGNLIIQGTSEAFTQPTTGTVTAAANNGVGLIRITTGAPQTILTGMSISITGVGGTTEANDVWTVTKIDTTHFDLAKSVTTGLASVFTNNYTSGGTWTTQPFNGFIELNGTASKSYNDNAVGLVVSDISASREKASKIFFWEERMGLMGSVNTINADQPNATLFFGEFAASGAAKLNNVILFDNTAGAINITVGKSGAITNAVPAKDYLYTFKGRETYSSPASEITKTGTGIGNTPTHLKDENNGCLNEDCACVVGDNEIEYITPDNRIMRINISTVSGAAVQFPDETFDEPMRNLLKDMDKDQTGARSVYHKAKRRSIHQVKILGQWYWLIHSNTTNENRGCWQAPQQVLFASSFFERNGILYATDGSDQTVYSIGTTTDDDGVPIQCTIATGDFLVGSVSMTNAQLEGEISQAALIKIQSFVTTNNGGRQGGSQKMINGSKFSYDSSHGIGIDPVGGSGVQPITATVADWQKEFDIFPSEANRCQIILTNNNGGYFSLFKFSINGNSLESFSTAL